MTECLLGGCDGWTATPHEFMQVRLNVAQLSTWDQARGTREREHDDPGCGPHTLYQQIKS